MAVVSVPTSGIVGETYVDSLIESLTLDQLRQMLATLWQGSGEGPSVRSRKDAAREIRAAAGTGSRIISAALEIESASAMKHCFVARVHSVENLSTLAAAPIWSEFLFGSVNARVARVRNSQTRLQMTLEHFVVSKEWRNLDDTTKVIEECLVRHPLILNFNRSAKTLVIKYPGYSPGSASKVKDRLSYETIIAGLVDALREKFSVAASALPVSAAIHSLQAAKSPRIRLVSADVEGQYGRVALSASNDKDSIGKVIAEIVGNDTLAESQLNEITTEFIKNSSANALLIFWSLEKVFTRIKFWATGAELLFIWNGQDPSSRVANDIVALLADVSLGELSSETRDAWNVVAQLKPGAIMTPRVLAERSHGSATDCRKVLIEASRAGLVEPVFRLKTMDMLASGGQRWTRDLSSLMRDHVRDDHSTVDGRDPENIDVGFRRIGEEVAE